jgi:phosphomannomutase
MLSVLSASEKSLSGLIQPLQRYSQSGEINFQVEDKDGKIREIADVYKRGEIDYLDGITVNLDGWWFNVRKSNTEPLLRLNLEARNPQMLEEKFNELKKLLGEPVHGH